MKMTKQEAIKWLREAEILDLASGNTKDREAVNMAISALQTQPTLCGYDIKHLMIIAEILRKENLPPERVTEALTDIGRIVSIVIDEFEESLRKAVEQCKI